MKNLFKNLNKGWVSERERGQAMMVAVLFFLGVSLILIYGVTAPVLKQQAIAAKTFSSQQSYFLAEGGIEDAIYRLKFGLPILPSETLDTGSGEVTITISDTDDGVQVIATGDLQDVIRRLESNVVVGDGVSFYYGIQAGIGGLLMENTASVTGNVYSNGPVIGSGPLNNIIRGSIVSGGPTGIINNVYATSSAFAHTITNSLIDVDAYYHSISNTTVLGDEYPGSNDPATSTMPISDAMIDDWKQVAEDGGVITTPCPYKITDEVTLGPVKIACDLEISGNNYSITLMGNVWVQGNITVKNSPTVVIDPSFGNKGVAVIADNPATPTTSGMISLENSAEFEGSTGDNSHVMFISMNRSAESGGTEVAILVKNTVIGDLLVYAPHGLIQLENNINLKEVSAYKIKLKNTANVVYETGVANLLFDSGPSGGYELLDWLEIE